MITTLHQSNAQDEQHDPTFVEMVKQRTIYEDLLEKRRSEFGSLPYCDTPGCPCSCENPTSSPVKNPQPTKRKDEDGFPSPSRKSI
ncbi:hypothetical protein TNIN_254851 [Trichonephila inaurata madagascariensis]|uniref:Uncharacterized protein n=1 Tax=Trichonephila inaurata madagascariensis TaxID=2747483 RepID=A0A8X6WUK1_9ARAC|nr:hypothetical protein TNIN_254851 [Trichonephila inaurata madagascariensis]